MEAISETLQLALREAAAQVICTMACTLPISSSTFFRKRRAPIVQYVPDGDPSVGVA